ncbi:MAG: thiol peroxidase [Candidatus Omnitrophica bacterium]|nr:thiol peroxidase [Candidatus Omnitrophota bacterium]
MSKEITFKGNVLHVTGVDLKVGDKAPDFKVVTKDLKEVGLGDYSGKIKILTTFPSIDTPVCEGQVKEFNEKVSSFENTVVLAISKDLPFAHSRFCMSFSINNVETLSDYKYSSVAENYGVLIDELKLLTRAVFIIDKDDIIRYVQFAKEITEPLNYQKVYEALKDI